ncbi:MAG: PilC/PilY family type IV pilus protein, partial [Lautropia sp.]
MNPSTGTTRSLLAPRPGAALALLLCAVLVTDALAAPAQRPLLGRRSTPAEPNVIYTIDDSGSMAWRYMPDTVSPWTNNDRWRITFHPGDKRSLNTSFGGNESDTGYDPSNAYLRMFSTRTNDLISARLRSPAYNTLYYNPEIRYERWFNSNGTQFPPGVSTAAVLNPNSTTWGTVSLEGTISYTGKLCTSTNLLPLVTTCGDVVNEPITPATYYQYDGGDINSLASYTRVRVMDFPSFDRGPARTDCTPNTTTGVTCTQAQEYQNFANWFVYNRNRTYVAITASSQAFAAQGSALRVGYGRIGQRSDISIDGVKTKTIERGVRAFAGPDRDAFFQWLYSTPAQSSTHLRRAVGDVGEYYSRADNRGPWGNTPGSDDPTAHLACRKSYNILMTDGYWNSDPAANNLARLNVDGLPGPLIANPAGGSYQYTPNRPFADLASDTLADVAMFYWNRDLRPDLANSVKPDAANPAFWQHMVNFTVGMGVDGTLRSPEDLPDLQSGAKNWPIAVPGESPTAIDDLWHAAINSRGRYLSAADPTTFATELSKILEEIANRNASEAGVSVSSQVLQVGNRKFVPGYVTGDWTGSITAIELDAAGQQLSPQWEASSKLPAYDSRNIYAGTRNSASPKAVSFSWSSLTAAMRTELGMTANSALVDYLRGNPALEGSTYRRRASRLGDVVNSQPTFVQGLVNLRYNLLPAGTPGAATYSAFVDAKKIRPGTLFVGANDGMLHAFRGSDGVEEFAFIPRS